MVRHFILVLIKSTVGNCFVVFLKMNFKDLRFGIFNYCVLYIYLLIPIFSFIRAQEELDKTQLQRE